MKDKNKNKGMGVTETVKIFAGKRAFLMPMSMLCSALGAVGSVIPYYFVWRLISELIASYDSPNQERIMYFAFAIVISQILSIALTIAAGLLSHYMAFHVESNIRRKTMKHLMRLPIGYFDKNETGKIRKQVDDNASLTHGLLAHLVPDLASTTTVPVVLLIMLVTIDIRFFFLCLAGLVVAVLSMVMMMGGKGRGFMEIYMESLENLNSEGVEYIRGIPVVKVFNQSVKSFKRFYQAIMKYDKYATSFVVHCRKSMLIYSLSFQLVAMLLIPLCAAIMNSSDNPLDVFVNAVFYMVISLLLHTTLMKVLQMGETVNQFKLSMQAVADILSVEPRVKMRGATVEESGIVFDDVTFAYDENRNVLENINLKFEHGKTYALVGMSGSGKTTLLNLLSGFYPTGKGSIRIDGTDIRSMSDEELSSKISPVMQENNLLKDSLKNNVSMKDKSKTEEEIIRAIHKSGADDIVEKLPEGIYTQLGTKGEYLSGGEIQRIAIARAFLKDAPILLLDEATAYADPENEHIIREAFDKLKREKTTIMIAHRLNTIRDVDEIIVLEKGRVCATGSHDELMRKSELYRKMYEEFINSAEWRVENE